MATISETLAAGLAQHQAGQYHQAEQIYLRVLAAAPTSTETLHLLGLLAQQTQQPVQSISYLDRAIALDAANPLFFTGRAAACRALGDFDGAETAYRRALQLAPTEAQIHYNLGLTLVDLGDLAQATHHFREAVRLKPNFAQAHFNLGLVSDRQGRITEAELAYKAAVQVDAGYAAAWHNLGWLLGQQQRFAEAASYMERAVQLEPENVDRLVTLGLLFWNSNQSRAAAQAYQYALERDPARPDAHLGLANALERLDELTEAETHYRAAIRLRPADAAAYHALGLMVNWQGRVNEARTLLETALQLEPTPRRQHDMAMLLPKVYQSPAEIDDWRQHQIDRLAGLEQAGVRLDTDQGKFLPNFYLAYQGFNDKSIHQSIARLYLSPAEPFAPGPPHPDGKIHVAFISNFFRRHTITHLNRGLIANLSRDKFFVTVFALEDRADEFVDFLKAHADEFVVLPQNLPAARQKIRAQRPDILFYTDIGMEPVTYALATARLAPVQCVTWGHPVTTGLPTMDYFISSRLYEPPQAQAHYTEKLVQLEGLNTYYYRPPVPDSLRGREYFGLSQAAHVYLCPQTLFKFHPDFDAILAAILQADPAGQLVLLDGQYHAWNDLLLRRFEQTMPQVVDRIRFLPGQSYPDFLNLLAVADVMLDTVHFGGGNTTLEALAVGTPVVTMPSDFLRGRLTYGFYQKMGLLACVARTPAEYVDIALRLGTNPGYRAEISRQITAAQARLYEDIESVRELENFFEAAVQQSRAPLAARPAELIDPAPAPAPKLLQQAFQLHQAGNLPQAEALYRQVLRAAPGCAEAFHLLGLLLHQLGQRDQAIDLIRRAILLDNAAAIYYSSLALIYADAKDLDQAVANYQRAVQLHPDDAEYHFLLGKTLREQGKPVEALASFERALQIQPADNLRVDMSLTLPKIYASRDDINTWRSDLLDRLDGLLAEHVQLDPACDHLSTTNFFLAYQGYNDRDVQQKIARLYAPTPHLPRRSGDGSKLKIGFISAHFKNHTIGRLNRGLITRLSRTDFHVTVLSVGRHTDDLAAEFRRNADQYLELPLDVTQARQIIAGQGLDILFYTDIGMSTLVSALAHYRLAPVQCVTWGHPVTSGLPAIDYFISSDLFEPPNAQAHYTEKLVQLAGLNTYYYRPQLPPKIKTRADFGLPDAHHLYICPQTLFKFHPDFDPLLGDILRRDPRGRLVLIRAKTPHWDQLLLKRFRQSMPDVVERVQFVGPQTPENFLNLLAVTDVMLDTIHFGGGNTTLEALAVGTPVVTLPSDFLRGRLTYGFYQKMGLLACVARTPAEYVEIALRLGANPGYRAEISRQISAANSMLFEDIDSVRELETFFVGVGRRQFVQPEF